MHTRNWLTLTSALLVVGSALAPVHEARAGYETCYCCTPRVDGGVPRTASGVTRTGAPSSAHIQLSNGTPRNLSTPLTAGQNCTTIMTALRAQAVAAGRTCSAVGAGTKPGQAIFYVAEGASPPAVGSNWGCGENDTNLADVTFFGRRDPAQAPGVPAGKVGAAMPVLKPDICNPLGGTITVTVFLKNTSFLNTFPGQLTVVVHTFAGEPLSQINQEIVNGFQAQGVPVTQQVIAFPLIYGGSRDAYVFGPSTTTGQPVLGMGIDVEDAGWTDVEATGFESGELPALEPRALLALVGLLGAAGAVVLVRRLQPLALHG